MNEAGCFVAGAGRELKGKCGVCGCDSFVHSCTFVNEAGCCVDCARRECVFVCVCFR